MNDNLKCLDNKCNQIIKKNSCMYIYSEAIAFVLEASLLNCCKYFTLYICLMSLGKTKNDIQGQRTLANPENGLFIYTLSFNSYLHLREVSFCFFLNLFLIVLPKINSINFQLTKSLLNFFAFSFARIICY